MTLKASSERRERGTKLWRALVGSLWLLGFVTGCDKEDAPAGSPGGSPSADQYLATGIADHLVLFDQAHFNIPGFEPLVELLVRHGYEVHLNRQPFTSARLKDADILVIGAPLPHDLSNTVAISPDGQTLASAGQARTLQLWDLVTGERLRTLRDTAWVGPLSFAADGRILAAGSADRLVKLWDVERGEVRAVFEHPGPIRSVSVSPDAGVVASAGDDGVVVLWEADSGRRLTTLTGHTGAVLHVTFSPNGDVLASCGDDGITILWDVKSGDALTTFTNHLGPVHHVAFAPDGRIVASASADGTVKVWDVEAGRVAFTLTEEAVSVDFSPDGSVLVTGGETTIKLWMARTGQLLTAIETDSDWVNSLTFSPDGNLLAWVDDDEVVRVWDVAARRVRHSLPGRVDALWGAGPAFSDEECETVVQWVFEGGALLLITDHAPWATPSLCLTTRFGVDMSNSNGTIDPQHHLPEGNTGWLVFTRAAGLLGDHPVTRGRNVDKRVNRVVTFYGQSLVGPPDFTSILTLSGSALDLVESGDTIPADGRAQGLAGSFGKGRVVVLGEAMMLMEPGLGRSDADNRQLAINIVRWLSGGLN